MKKLFILGFLLCCINQVIYSQIVKIEHVGFTMFYDLAQKHTIYSTYILSKKTNAPGAKRSSNKFDPLLPSASQNGSSKYINTPDYDIGHLVPFNDFSSKYVLGHGVNIWSNMVLQNSSLNRGVWASLEDYISTSFSDYNEKKTILVGASYSAKKINGQYLPYEFWKICIYKNDTLCWVFKNEKPMNTNIGSYLVDRFAMRQKFTFINNIKILAK